MSAAPTGFDAKPDIALVRGDNPEAGRLTHHRQRSLGSMKGKVPRTRLAIFLIDQADKKNFGFLGPAAGPGDLKQGLEHGCHTPLCVAGTAAMNATLVQPGLELFIQHGKAHRIQMGRK
jgi:hypothetical protein